MRAGRTVLAALMVGALLFAACGGDDDDATPKAASGGGTKKLGNISFEDHGTTDAKGKAEIDLEADSFYFAPTFIRGNPGQQIKLNVENESSAKHNISITDAKIDTDVAAKAKASVTVTFPASGVLLFFCKYHADSGMNGELLSGNAEPQAVQVAASGSSPVASGASPSASGGSSSDYSY